jgi:hypothetical protein
VAVSSKLRDPGASLADLGAMSLEGKSYAAARLTFAPGTGESPEDWYIVYRDEASGRVHAMAYIVTYGTTVEKANQEPHAIVYDRYEEVEGVPVAVECSFRLWSKEQGIHGERIGRLLLSGPRFVMPAADAFVKPAGAREEKLPGAP